MPLRRIELIASGRRRIAGALFNREEFADDSLWRKIVNKVSVVSEALEGYKERLNVAKVNGKSKPSKRPKLQAGLTGWMLSKSPSKGMKTVVRKLS